MVTHKSHTVTTTKIAQPVPSRNWVISTFNPELVK